MALPLHIVSISVIVSLLSFGIAGLIISSIVPLNACGLNGSPSLGIWVYGEGIGYTTAGSAFLLTYIIMIIFDFPVPILLVLILCGPFMLIWTIVGGISLWGNGIDCHLLVPELFNFSTACVVYFCAFIPLFLVGLPFAICGN